MDVGCKVWLVTAQGVRVEHPRQRRTAERYLAKCHRRVAKRKQGRHRRRNAGALLAKAQQTVRRQRADFHHQTAPALLRANETISREALRVRHLVRNHHLAKSIGDAGWAQVRAILAAKAACAGRRVLAVHPASTSQACSGCGVRVHQSLSVRTPVCTACGLVLDRDENAAITMQRAGQALRGVVALAAATIRESPCL
jgi:putative transposase